MSTQSIKDGIDALTPEALHMLSVIARAHSLSDAAKTLGLIPSALSYRLRQLEDSLDILLVDRKTRKAKLTDAGLELCRQGERLLPDMMAIVQRVKRIASGWEPRLTLAVDSVISPATIFDLIGRFYELNAPTEICVYHEVMNGTWEAILDGRADLALGVPDMVGKHSNIHNQLLGDISFVFAVSPKHPLAHAHEPLEDTEIAQHRVVVIADSALGVAPRTIGVLPGQSTLTVPTLTSKIDAQVCGLGCGFLPLNAIRQQLADGKLIQKEVVRPPRITPMFYAWRRSATPMGNALKWWLEVLADERTRSALLGGKMR